MSALQSKHVVGTAVPGSNNVCSPGRCNFALLVYISIQSSSSHFETIIMKEVLCLGQPRLIPSCNSVEKFTKSLKSASALMAL